MRGVQRRAHAFAAFRHRLVAKAHDIENALRAVADMDLHVHFARLDAFEWKQPVSALAMKAEGEAESPEAKPPALPGA